MMFGKSERPSVEPKGKSSLRRRRGRAIGNPAPPIRPRGRTAPRFLDCEILETRRLLSGDLTSDIGQLLSNGQTTGTVDLGTVSLGNDLNFSGVTVSFPSGLTQSGSDWTGTISVSATSASLAIGTAVSAQVDGQGTAPGITGSYTLTNEPAGQGAYQLSASQFDLTLSNLLTAQASNIAIDYSPTAAAGQNLVQVGSLSAKLLPFENTTVTVDNLDILDNGFTLGDGTITAPPITLGNVLSINQPSLTLSGVGYTGGAWTGTIGLTAATASLFPGQSDFSATVDAPGGSYSLASQTLTLSAGNLDLNVGHILQATGSKLSFSLDDSQSPPAATFDAGSIALTSPDFPSATGTISDFSGSSTGFTIASASLTGASAVTFSNVLKLSSPSLSVSNFSYTPGAATPVTGTIQVGGTVELFPGQSSFSTTVSGFTASYDIGTTAFDIQASSLGLDLGKVLKATTGAVDFSFDDSSGTPAVSFDVKDVNLASPDFPGVTGTIGELKADNTGFSVASATLSDSSAVAFGKILEVSAPSLSLTDFTYTPGAATPVTGTFTVGGTLELFPGQTSFSTTVSGFQASYNIGASAFDIQATSIELDLGKVVTATTGAVNFTFDDSSGTPAVSFDVKNVALKSTDFSQATGSIGELKADDTGFSVASASLDYSGSITLGGVLSITGLSLGIENFSYTTGAAGASPTVGGTITFGAQSVSLFSGQSDFTTTISDPTGKSPSGLSGSYDINTQALNLQLDQVQVQVSDLLDVTASNVSVDVAPGAFGLTVGSATASVPKLSGLEGSVQNLAITSDGFSIGTATLGYTGTIKLGSVLTISNPSASISGLGYSISQGAQFSGDVGFGLSATLNVGGVASASVTGLEVTLGLTPQDYGQFLVTASSASFSLGNYLTLTAAGTSSAPLEFNTAPGSGQDIVQFGTVAAKLDAGPLSVSATGQDFAIDASGNFVALTGFGIAASASAAGGINAANVFQWPTFLPIQVSSLALSWPDFNADPSNFSVEISAGINASLAGLTLSGSVQDAVLNVQDIVNGQFPLTSLKGAGFQVGGTFAGVTFNAEGFLATTAGSNGQTILYGGIDGGVDIAGLAGFQIMLGISSLGPLDVYAMVDAPIILDPDTGLALTDLSAGINFGGGITPPTSAKNLGAAAQGVFAPTLSQWESQLAADVADQISTGASWTNPPTLLTIQGGATLFDAYASPDAFELSGHLAFDTTGKLLASGTVVMGATVNVQGSAYIDLSQVASGKAVLMLNVDAPAGNPIVTAYGTVDFEFDGPVFNSVQAPSGSSTPQLGDGVALDGSTGYGSAPNINLNNTSYTVEFWAQRSAAGQEEYVIGQAPSSSTTGLSIGFDTNNDFVVHSGGTTLSFPAGQDTSWHHWAVTYDQTSKTLSIYRDGILETIGTAAPIQGASSTLLVGKSGSIFFSGGVDEVRVWTLARTASQVADNLALTTPSPTTSLLADWSFGEGQGTSAADSSGNNNTLALTGGVTWAPTVIGGTSKLSAGPTAAETAGALQLDGTDAYASASGINLNNTSFSVELWAKQNDTARLEYLINQGDPPSSGGLQIGFDASNNFFVSFGGTTLSTPTNDNSWHHWAVTFDAASGKLLIYQDGVPVAGTTANPIAISGSTPAFLIGKSGAYYFDGDITQVRVWTVARTETDVNSDMVSSTPTSTIGLLAAWNFSEGKGTTAADSSGNGHDATINGGATWISATLPTLPTPPFEGFTITISGGVDLTIPHVPGGLEITGTASFRVDATAGSLQLNVSGMVDLAPLGNALDLEGVVHFDLGPQPYTNPTPELYGIFVLQTGQLFNTLSSLGLNVNGMAVLRFNTTSNNIPIDLPIPSSDPTQPAVLQSFVIQADAASVMIQGDVNFQLGGQQWFGLSGTFDAIFQDPIGQAELDILENASLIIGPPAAPIVEFQTTGFLRLWSGGVAAQFQVTFDAQDSSVLTNAGLDFTSPIDPLTGKPVANQFLFELNTSGQAVSFTAPTLTSSDPGLTAGTSGLTINIPAGAPQPDGSTAAAGPYMVVEGSGGFELDGSFAVIGSFYLEVTTSQFLVETEAQVFLQVQNNVLLDLQADGGIDISSQGIYGAIQLTVNTGLPSGYGFSLNAGFLLEVNTTGQTPKIAGIALPAGPFAEIKATGDLQVGTFDLNGSFIFEVDGSGLTMTLTAQAAIGPLGQANIDGDLVILGGDHPGLYGILQAALASSPSIPDVNFNLNFQFEINTTDVNQTVTGFTVDPTTGQITTGQQLTIGAGGVQIDAGGSLTIVNMFDVQGQFDFTIDSSGLQIDAQAALTGFFGLDLGFNAQLDLSSAGLVVNAGLTLNESLPLGLLSISASPQLLINTTNETLDGVAPSTYEVQLNNADVNFLGLQASGTLIVGVSDGIFEIDVPSSDPLQLSFFGLGGVSISGYIDSNGQFSLTGSIGFDLGQSGNDIWGSLQITISNSGFSGYFGGGCQIFGINVASVSGWLTIDNGYIDLGASVSVWIFSFGFNIGIGQLQMPQYSPNELLFYSVPTTANAGSTISLDASATDGSGNPAGDGAYSWTIYYDNAVYAQETGANPKLKLGDPGTYKVVMNEGGVTKTSTIQVVDVPPTISSLNLQTGYAAGQSVTLAPSVYSPLPEAPGGLHYQWTILKDGQAFATANTPTYTFTPAAPGMVSEGAPVPDVYQVSLTVSDNYGGSVSASGSFGTFDPNNIVVTTTQDLTQPGAVTSLRVAIQEAESVSGVHYVKFASDLAGQTITLSTVGDSSDHGASAIAIPGGTVVLDASNAPGVTINAGGAMRLFYVPRGSTLELQDLNLSGGEELGDGSGSYGGAIYADGSVYASNCAFVNNTAIGNYYDYAGGGAIYVSNTGYLFAVETTFGDNSVQGYGQAVGGAIDTAGALGLEHVTIAGNSVWGSNQAGGGVYDTASNQPNPYGGGPFPLFTFLGNVLIADNTGGVDFDYEGNSGGQINDALIGTSANLPSVIFQTIGYSPFIQGQNPLLGPLADHGDGVLTYSLMPGSPALNNGLGPYESYVLDGRGYPFPAYGSDSIGAFQSQPYVVTNTNDSGPGSLRAAISEDDSNLPIIFAPNLAGQVISLSSGPITITHNLAIQGLGADKVQVVSGTVAPIPTDLWVGNGNTNDTSGAAPGYPVGTLSYGSGMVGQAFQLNGASDITIPDNQTLDSSSFTVGGWYNLSQSQESILASKYGGGPYYNGWILGIHSSGVPYFQVLASPSSNIELTSSQPLSLNAWHYIAATYDGNNVALYVDGTEVASGTLAGGYTPSALPMEIGGASWYPAGYTTGLVNQFAFYSTALTANQITATYDATLSLSQPAYEGYGIFNVASGVTVTVSGLTLGNGDAVNGGAFNNAGALTITGAQFVHDSAPAAPSQGQAASAYGGAIYNANGGFLQVTDSSFINDAALGGEGQVSGSNAGTGGNAYGGAIYNAPGALLGAADNTFTGDYATGGNGDSTTSTSGQAGAGFGGAIDNAGTAYLVSLTIAGNAVSGGTGAAPGVPSDGAGLYNAAGATLSMTNTIVAENTGADIIVNGQLVAQDTGGNDVVNLGTATGQSNLVTSNAGLAASTIVSTADPKLAHLLNTGGSTSTLVELPGSPAIGAGDTAVTGLPVFPFAIPGLSAWWQGNNSGQDAVGSLNATLQNGATYGPGLAGEAFQFNGTTAYASIPPSADIVGTGAFSISAWIRTTGSSGVIIQQRDPSNFNGQYQLALSGGKVSFFVYGNYQYDFQMLSNASVNDGNWHNIVIVRQADGTGEIFIDGNLDSTASGPDVPLGSGFNVYLGADLRDGADYFNGLIENVALFNTALTSTNVENIDQGTTAPQSTDQRGDARIYNGAIDIGAVEEQPYEVTNTNDSGPGSLRQEIANDAAGDQPVTFAPDLAGQTITLTSGPITIKNNVVIEGLGAGELMVSGGHSSQIFVVDSGNVSISGLTLTDGLGSQGGAIANGGNLTIRDCLFTNNVAQDNSSLEPALDSAGGAIINRKGATLIVTGTTFSGNEATGVATSRNDGNAYGGAIENLAGATFNGTSDTFYGNSAKGGAGGGGFGGAIDNAGSASLVDSTVEENSIVAGSGTPSSPSAGAGINNQAGATSAIISTILSYNHGGDDLANAGSGTVTGPEIVGLPVTNPAGSTITLTGYSSGAGATAGAVANNVWTFSTGTGQEVVAAENLVFNGPNPIVLPSGLISSATNLSVDVSFSTTGDGVILGYQDAPLGTTPTDSTPALYVGTDGFLHGGIAGFGMFQSTAPVNDGKAHDVTLAIDGSTMTVTIDGTQVAQISGSIATPGMTYNQIGTGFGGTALDVPAGGPFPFTGTINSLTITQGTALAGTITTDGSSVDQVRFTPPAVGNYTVGLSSTSSNGSITSTSQTLATTDVAPTPTIAGLPATGAVNQAYNLAGMATDPVASDTAAGFNDVWTVSAGTGQQSVAATNLVFNGANPIALPSGLIHDATSLEIGLTFQTTGDGVLLSYQDQPLAGEVPTSYVPMLYIGTNGRLYFDFYNGPSQPIESASALNDGQQHTVTIQWDGSTLSYTLDAQTSGTITGFTPQMADMTYDTLGTGYAANYPNAPSGDFPFTGTINSLSITTGTTLLGALKSNLGAGNQAVFTPLISGTYTIGLSSTNVLGHTGTTSQTFSTVATIPAPAITNLPSSSPEGTSITLTASATESNATVAAEGFSYLWQATDANGTSATGTGALSFNGTSQFVDLGNPGDLNFNGPITLDAWVLPESSGGLQDIIAHGFQTSPNNAEDFLRIDGGYYQVGSWNGNDAVAQAAIPASDIGHWVNLAGVYDGSQWILYRDGVQVGSSAPTSQGALTVSSYDWTLGAGVNGSQRFFQGELADAGIWNIGLSAAAVKGLMAASPAAGNPGVVAYYPFNEAAGSTAVDATGNGNNGTLGGINPNNPTADPTRVAGIVVGPNVTLSPGESGTETVALQAFDAAGGSGITTATFTASPIPIIIDGGGNAVVQQGTLLTRSCTFTDLPGDGPWTVSILFGDGTPLQTQVVNTPAFTISHVFENAGTFLTIVTVTNRNGFSGSFNYTATVSGFTVNDGSPRPEPVRKLIYTFNNPTEIRPKAFELLRDGKPSHVHLKFARQPDGQTYLITFGGHGVIDGALPAGHYKLITHHRKVRVVSGAPMTANDINTFISVSGRWHDHRKDNGVQEKPSHDRKIPHRKAPAKFPGRTVHHPGAIRLSSSTERPARGLEIKAQDRLPVVPMGALALTARHHR